MIPTVTIVGRINTGKSTLFNCLTESRRALVSTIPGTTRDRNMAQVQWQGWAMRLVDTGGVDIDDIKNSIQMLLDKKSFKDKKGLGENILFQTYQGIADADIIILLVDGKAGLLAQDKEIAAVLKKIKKPVVVACNKIDSPRLAHGVSEFFRLGFGEPHAVSAANGSGTGDLLDAVVEKLKKLKNSDKQSDDNKIKKINVSIIGKPNAGKSSLLNSLVGHERVIVTEVPMTTREPQDTDIIYKEKSITLVDTAGIKRRAKLAPGLDTISSAKAESSIHRSDIVLYVVDASLPFTIQDTRLAGSLNDSLAGIIIVANKWDKISGKTTESEAKIKNYIYRKIHPLSWAPIIIVSAKTGKNVKNILELILEVFERRNIKIEDKTLNTFLKKLIKKKLPTGGMETHRPRIIKIRQEKTNPPEFIVYHGNDAELHESYYRYIKNTLRKIYKLEGVNMKITSVYPPS